MVRHQVRVAAAIAIVLFGLSACSSSAPKAAAPAITAPVSATAAAPSASTSGITMCSVGKMTVTVDAANSAEISGRENVVFDLHNAGTAACTFDGYPSLLGGSGLTNLKFPHTAAEFARGVTGAGPIPAGGVARFTATIAIKGCSKPAPHYTRLGIELPGVQLLSMKFPAQLAKSGCPLGITRIGPVTTAG